MRNIYHPMTLSHTGMHTPSYVSNSLGASLLSHAQFSSITPHSPFRLSIPFQPANHGFEMAKKTNRIRRNPRVRRD